VSQQKPTKGSGERGLKVAARDKAKNRDRPEGKKGNNGRKKQAKRIKDGRTKNTKTDGWKK